MSGLKTYTPLRYPGGKNRLTNCIKQILDSNNLDNSITYIEPYAGGASVALNLLITGRVKKIIINDLDRSVYAFWYSVLNYTEEFCQLISDTNITIDEWQIQKQIQKEKDTVELLKLGFSTLFLNRTNRSGILKGGVIGGLSQNGNYKLDCRFNKKSLIQKIKEIAKYKKNIKLYNLDTLKLINSVIIGSTTENFIFFDPPYYKQGASLYVNSYKHEDHLEISKKISRLRRHKWIITYDNTPEIDKMYEKFKRTTYCLNYSAQSKYIGTEIMVFSNNINIPENLKYI